MDDHPSRASAGYWTVIGNGEQPRELADQRPGSAASVTPGGRGKIRGTRARVTSGLPISIARAVVMKWVPLLQRRYRVVTTPIEYPVLPQKRPYRAFPNSAIGDTG